MKCQGELKMLKKDFESAAMYIRQQQEEIEGLKVLLKKSSVASQVGLTADCLIHSNFAY